MAKSFFALAGIIARIVIGSQFMVDRFVQLDTAFFDVLLEKIVNADKLNAFICIPFLQTKPGRIVSVPSFGQNEVLALELLVVLDDTTDHLFHGFVITGKETPVDTLPVL